MKEKAHTIGLAAAVVFLLALIVGVVYSQNGYVDYKALQQKKAALVEENNQARGEIWRLRREATRLKNDVAYIEYIARTEFGMGDTNDVVYKFSTSGESR